MGAGFQGDERSKQTETNRSFKITLNKDKALALNQFTVQTLSLDFAWLLERVTYPGNPCLTSLTIA